MRYLYITALAMFICLYTFSVGAAEQGADGMPGKDDDGGNAVYVEANVQTNANFMVNKPEDFENAQTNNNAIRLKFKSPNEDCSIYAKISSYTTPNGADRSNIPIELEYRSDNSNKTSSLVTTPVHLTYNDQRLFVNKKDKKEYQFHYDLRLLPLGYDYPEGQYNFTIMFTMTQP